MRVSYIAEGSKEWGIGHIMDIANWANELKFKVLQSQGDIVILDIPNVSVEEVKWHQGKGAKVVTCCSEGAGNGIADIVIYPADGQVPPNTKEECDGRVRFCGPKYLMLRPEFYRFKGHHVDSGKVETIAVMLGGTDAAGLSKPIMEQLKNYDVIRVQGRGDIPELLARVDLAIVSPSFAMWEALYVGCPVLIVPQNDRQRRYGVAFPCTENLGGIPELIRSRQFVYPKPEYEIAAGKQELIEEILR